jgi:hypothetical protein
VTDASSGAETSPRVEWLGLPVHRWVGVGVSVFVLGFLVGYLRAAGYFAGGGTTRAFSFDFVVVGAVLGGLLGAYAMLLPVAYQLLRSFGSASPATRSQG